MTSYKPVLFGGRVPLGTQVADALRDEITQLGLSEGDELPSESALAAKFGVSGRVVRDALRSLDSQGVIQTRQGKRAKVSSLRPIGVENYFRFAIEADALSVDELLELRLLLEVPAARLAAERATATQIARIKRLLIDLQESGTRLETRVPADVMLHDAITELSGNRFVHGILHSLSNALAEERRVGGELQQARGSQHRDSDEAHAQLVAAIEAHDLDAAEAAARTIVEAARSRLAERD